MDHRVQPHHQGWQSRLAYCVGDETPFNYDFATKTPGLKFNCSALKNVSLNNMGLTGMPRAPPAKSAKR